MAWWTHNLSEGFGEREIWLVKRELGGHCVEVLSIRAGLDEVFILGLAENTHFTEHDSHLWEKKKWILIRHPSSSAEGDGVRSAGNLLLES